MARDSKSSSLAGAMIGAFATIAAAVIAGLFGLIHFGSKDPSLRFPVAVLDSGAGNAAIPDAEISLSLPEFPTELTDSGGIHTFPLSKALIGKSATLTVRKEGYVDYSQQILSLQPRDEYLRIYLKRPQVAATAATPPDQPPEQKRVYPSGPKPSGVREAFSDWYQVCSTDQPSGYHIDKERKDNVDFRLSGDRSCGAWSECQLVSKEENQVCWRFRLQGHNEWPPPGQALSEGILTVVWSRNK